MFDQKGAPKWGTMKRVRSVLVRLDPRFAPSLDRGMDMLDFLRMTPRLIRTF